MGKSGFLRSSGIPAEVGYYILANPGLPGIIRGKPASLLSGRTVVSGTADATTEDLLFFRDLIEAGKIRSVVDRFFRLNRHPTCIGMSIPP